MYSLLAQSFTSAKRIFWHSLIEWSLFLGLIAIIAHQAGVLLLASLLPLMSSFSLGFTFLPLSQVRTVLLSMDLTGSLDLSKILPSIRSMFRFAYILGLIPVAISVVLTLVVYQLGGFQDLSLAQFRGDPIGLMSEIFIQYPTNIYLQLLSIVIAFIFLFAFSSAMVPFAAVAANLGDTNRAYDTFHGYGAYRYKAFFVTLIVHTLNGVIIFVLISGSGAFFYFGNIDADGQFQGFDIPAFAWVFWGLIYMVWLFVQNIWYSACAILFKLYNEDVAADIQGQYDHLYGREYQNSEIRNLRRLRMQK